jgi:chromate transporter
MLIELLKMFFMFFKIGLFTFGGGYAMIPLMKAEAVDKGYVTANMMYDFIGISESTPGPFAVNMATFIGMTNYGFIGAIVATLGIVLPSFIIILLIASIGSKWIESKPVNHAFIGLKPAVIGLIGSVSIRLITLVVFPHFEYPSLSFDFSDFNIIGLLIIIIVTLSTYIIKKMTPFRIVLLSALLGILFYSLF